MRTAAYEIERETCEYCGQNLPDDAPGHIFVLRKQAIFVCDRSCEELYRARARDMMAGD